MRVLEDPIVRCNFLLKEQWAMRRGALQVGAAA
jgi:hypothetical protein